MTAAHVWVGATEVPLTESEVRHANRRGTARVREQTKLEILQIYCAECRLDFDKAADKPCAAEENKALLIGGPVGTRRQRDESGELRVRVH